MTATARRERSLGDYCQYLRGVGPVRAQRLAKLGVETVNDLLTHFPRKYYDRRNFARIATLKPGEGADFVGRVLSLGGRPSRNRRPIVTAAVGDETGVIQVVWFNQPYLARHLKPGTEIVVNGELSYFRGARQIVNPDFEIIDDARDLDLIHTGRIVPVYPLTSGVSQRFMRDLVARTLEQYAGAIEENLPLSVVREVGTLGRLDALRGIHFPDDESRYRQAVWRLKFEELFLLQVVLSLQRRGRSRRRGRPRFGGGFSLQDRFVSALPFDLTAAQSRVLDEIRADLSGERGMNRLLQGDVGSGKTVLAGATLLAAVEAGFQAALMAPTEILAAQHAKTLSGLFHPVGVPVSLLIGSMKPSEKRELRERIAAGSDPVVVGTHALIQEDVRFGRLGLVIVDEQHRFGVRQRAALLGGGHPHMLVMTATPIPRTLALTAYADLDLSVIDELPPGRMEVKTRLVGPEKREAMYEFIRREVETDRRAYFLYPVIDDTEKQDVEAAVSAHAELSTAVYPDLPVGLLHGRMPFTEKERVMSQFASGSVRILVATTVIEVGVHVPEATIMVIHHPERFGLSQLHQLRGRVGRGGRPGYCFLLLAEDASSAARARLDVLTRVQDGFRIAEEDLRLRGPGEFFGTRQHGAPGLRIANPVVDQKIVETARTHAKALLDSDPRLEGAEAAPCRRYLLEFQAEALRGVVG